MKRTTRMISMILVLASLFGALALTTNATSEIKSAIGIVDASALRLRKGPSTNDAIITQGYRNDAVVIVDQEGDWYKVIYNLKTGYMHRDYLIVKERENVELGYGAVSCYLANVRSQPNTSSSIVSQVSSGTKLFIIGFNCGWYKVQFSGKTGYIRSDLLDLTEIPYDNRGGSGSSSTTGSSSSGSGTSSSGNSSGSSSGSSAGQAIVAKAKEYLGVPYVWGGSSPSGFDCSGFTQYVMRVCGYSINRTATAQLSNGYEVSYSNLQPGDLVFFHHTYNTNSAASHVGIYVGNGNFIHAGNGGITITSLSMDFYASRYLCARRIV